MFMKSYQKLANVTISMLEDLVIDLQAISVHQLSRSLNNYLASVSGVVLDIFLI